MMSSEEEPDCFGPYGDKLSKKAKRSRQRVDAGEPRNSYSSIPNFSSRPSFLSGSLYGAFLSQGQHLGLLGQGFPPAKMLNELLGRQVKQAADATTPTEAMITMEAAGSVDVNYECLNSTTVIRRGLEDDSSPPPGDVAHHMLRDILQGRKKEFLALEQELRASSNPAPLSPDNNNSINNNNNEVKPNVINGSEVNHSETNGDVKPVVNGVTDDPASGGEDPNADEILSDDGKTREEENNLTHVSDSEQSIVSPADSIKLIKEEPEEAKDKTEQLELKRARVENIVSSMRSSPSLPTQVNGCKKRKLYHPQQHDTSDRYSSIGLAMNMGMFIDDESGDNSIDNSEIRQKKVEKDALKNQLRTMQEQLAEMKQKYAQLCTRMEDSECPNEEDGSDIDQDNNSLSLPDKPMKRSPTITPVKEIPHVSTQVSTPTHPTVTPAITKMITPKLQPPVNTPQLPMPPNFNGALSLLQQQVLQEHPISHHHSHHHHHPQMTHHALSNAAAMYLGVSHKLFMEQEARLNKEAALAAEQHQQQINQQQQQQPQQQQQQQQQSSLHHHPQLHPSSIPPQPQQHSMPATSQHSQTPTQNAQSNRQSPSQMHQPPPPKPDYSDRLLRPPGPTPDLEGLADVLKTEITSSLGTLIDQIMSRFVQQKRLISKPEAAAELNKDLMLASQLLDRKSPRTKVIDRGSNGSERSGVPTVNGPTTTPTAPPRINGTVFPVSVPHQSTPDSNISAMNLPIRPNTSMFQPPKPPTSISSALYSGIGAMGAATNPFCLDTREGAPEQNEALSLVVAPKKKRHKVTDTRITPRTVSRILAQDGMGSQGLESSKFGPVVPSTSNSSESPPPRSYHAPPPILPVSLPTSVAIPNPSLHESQVFSPYSPFYHQSHPQLTAGSPPEMRDSPPLPHPPSLLHPALLAAAQHGTSPDYAGMRVSSALNSANDNVDRTSDCNSGDGPYDGITPTSSTLTPMHLRKAKLMFFWVRYPSSAVLKMYFPDIKFNKNNTAQLVKWFSNFREFYYIQMEKYARQAVSEGVKSSEDLHVSGDCEIYRVLNLHYNRNNHIEVPPNFRYVVEQTLKEFFKAIQGGKDTEQSWKKSIYKIISRLDDPVPEYFKSPNFLEQLE